MKTIRALAFSFPACALSAVFLSWGYVTEAQRSVAYVFYALSLLLFLEALHQLSAQGE